MSAMLDEEPLPSYILRYPNHAGILYDQVETDASPSAPDPSVSDLARPAVRSYQLHDKLGCAWLTLTLHPSSPSSGFSGSPVYHDGDILRGEVRLDLKQDERMKDISVILRGTIDYRVSLNTFLENKKYLWSSERSGNLRGNYVWPFTLKLPEKALLASDDTMQSFKLPSTFYDEYKRWSVSYGVEVILHRDNLLRPDDKLVAPIEFVPLVHPSPKRPLGYREDAPFSGSDIDQDDWTAIEPILLLGNGSGSCPVAVTCKLSAATPLCYTRGTVIHCTLTIETNDQDVLEILSSETAPQVKLTRKVGIEEDKAMKAGMDHGQTRKIPVEDIHVVSVTDIGTAMWQKLSEKNGASQTRRTLNGEIYLSQDLTPSCFFPGIAILYDIVMYPFNTSEFSSGGSRDRTLWRQGVDIVATHLVGPSPLSQLPPTYTSITGCNPRTGHQSRFTEAMNIARPFLPGSGLRRPRQFIYDFDI